MRGCSRIGYGAEGARHQVPLRDLLQLDDETVEVVRYENFYAAGHDDASEELKFLTRHSAKTVRARAVPSDQPQVGRRYLYFLYETEGQLLPMFPIHTFELQDRSIRRLCAQGEWGWIRE